VPNPQATKLASATVPCPNTDKVPHLGCINGRVLVFPDATGVRVACTACGGHRKYWNRAQGYFTDIDCKGCMGRGWTAATDGWVWWSACWGLIDLPSFQVEWLEERYRGGRGPEAAFFAALDRAVSAMPGVEFADVT